jgi:hypothetical protein
MNYNYNFLAIYTKKCVISFLVQDSQKKRQGVLKFCDNNFDFLVSLKNIEKNEEHNRNFIYICDNNLLRN